MSKNVVAYLRVSTEAQTEKYGLDMQKQKILEYAEKNQITISKWYVDGGYSGSKLDRPQIMELLNDAEQGKFSKILIYKLDRMSRDAIDTLTLLYRLLPQYGIEIVSMTEDLRFENPMDKVVIGVNALMGQYEREVIYMRTRAGMLERIKKGLWMGGGRVPFGYRYDRNDGILHPIPEQAEIVRKAYNFYIDGYSCDKIAKILGFKNERIVAQIIKRKSNIGLIEYKGQVYKGLHEPIVSEDVFYNAQNCMKMRSTNSHISNNNILTGLCYCGKCGARMRYHKWDGNHRLLCYSQIKGKEYMQRDCNCNNSHPKAKDVEEEVEKYFREFVINIDENSDYQSNSISIENTIKKSKSKVKKLYNLYAENESDNLLSVIQEEEELIKTLTKQLQEELSNNSGCIQQKIEEIKHISDVWEELTNKEKNKILKQCIEKIVITDNDFQIYFIMI